MARFLTLALLAALVAVGHALDEGAIIDGTRYIALGALSAAGAASDALQRGLKNGSYMIKEDVVYMSAAAATLAGYASAEAAREAHLVMDGLRAISAGARHGLEKGAHMASDLAGSAAAGMISAEHL
jgi:hypothetical protein